MVKQSHTCDVTRGQILKWLVMTQAMTQAWHLVVTIGAL